MIIYKVTNLINNKIYIGQTIRSLKRRKKQHEKAGLYKNCRSLLDKAIQKYGADNFKWEIIDTATNQEELNKKESYYIEKFDTTNLDKGYNLKGGGHNPYLTETVKRKIGDAQKGEKNHMYGKTGSNNPASKKVINLTTNVIYESASECARIEQIKLSHLCAVCRGERATCNKNEYKYLDENNNIIKPVSNVIKREKPVVLIETVQVFESVTAASIFCVNSKKQKENISKVCKNQRRTACGYHWKFFDVNTEPSL